MSTPESASDRPRRRWWTWAGLAVALFWAVVLAYFLLAPDPPDFWFEDIAAYDEPGHLLASMFTGGLVFLLIARRSAERTSLLRVGLMSLGLTLTFLLGLEALQTLLADRGVEQSDVTLTLIGSLVGVGAGWGTILVRRRMKAGAARRGR